MQTKEVSRKKCVYHVSKGEPGVERKKMEREKMNRKEQKTENQGLIGAVSEGNFHHV